MRHLLLRHSRHLCASSRAIRSAPSLPTPFSRIPFFHESTTSAPTSTDRLSPIVDELANLTLLEAADLTDLLRNKIGVDEMPVMAVMMPGMGMGVPRGRAPGGPGAAAKAGEEKKEKTAFDLKLEGFDAASKIKVIKEVRAFTDLGLKEAKELVEKAPTLLKKGVTKEEAEKIVEKLKAVGAKVIME